MTKNTKDKTTDPIKDKMFSFKELLHISLLISQAIMDVATLSFMESEDSKSKAVISLVALCQALEKKYNWQYDEVFYSARSSIFEMGIDIKPKRKEQKNGQ